MVSHIFLLSNTHLSYYGKNIRILPMPDFIPGLELSERFYYKAARPIIDAAFPGLTYSAALIGYGSEVLGFDGPISRDHHWGPRFLLFLPEIGFEDARSKLNHALQEKLPHEFYGYPTSYDEEPGSGIRRASTTLQGPVKHFIEFYTVKSFLLARLEMDPRQEIEARDWVTFPEQRLLEIISGKVFHDGLGELEPLRTLLNFYPRDVWLYRLAAQWEKMSQLEAFVGRCGESGDEFGSRLIATKITDYACRLCFLMEKKYAPYPKWFGTGFSRLDSATELTPLIVRILNASSWNDREQYLAEVYGFLAKMHNSLSLTQHISEEVTDYYGRPYLVIHTIRFADALNKIITDRDVALLPSHTGSIDQLLDQPDPIFNTKSYQRIKDVYSE
jgi:hypothetical protein